MFPRFLAAYDGVASLAMVTSILARSGVSLDEVVDGLPAFHKGQTSVFCPADRKGAVMRAVSEASSGAEVDLTEGVRVAESGGWVLVLPHSNEPEVTVWAEGEDEASLGKITDRWVGVVQDAIGPE